MGKKPGPLRTEVEIEAETGTGQDQALVLLADALAETGMGLRGVARQAKGLRVRLDTANRHRRRVLSLLSGMLKSEFADDLKALGASDLDIESFGLDTPFDGLLLALARRGRGLPPMVAVGGRVRKSEYLVPSLPETVADLLGWSALAIWPGGEVPEELGALVVLRGHAFQQEFLDLAARASIVIAGTDPKLSTAPADLRASVADLADKLKGVGRELVHVAGDGAAVAFVDPKMIDISVASPEAAF